MVLMPSTMALQIVLKSFTQLARTMRCVTRLATAAALTIAQLNATVAKAKYRSASVSVSVTR